MPAPKRPNPGPGAAARSAKARERKLEAMAEELRKAGYGVLTSEEFAAYLDDE